MSGYKNHVAPIPDPNMVPYVPFEEYSEKFAQIFDLTRSEDGIIIAKLRSPLDGGSPFWATCTHRGIWQFLQMVGQDPEAELLIFGGSGKDWIALKMHSYMDESSYEGRLDNTYNGMYYDGTKINEALTALDIPTIGVLNGSGFHFEMPLVCDICLMAEEASVFDPHFSSSNVVPGDGIQIGLRYRLGPSRANYAMLTGMLFDSKTALEWGLVNEVVPRDRIYDRAIEIAKQIMTRSRVVRRATVDLLRRELRQQLADEGRLAFGHEMWSYLVGGMSHGNPSEESLNKFKRMGCDLTPVDLNATTGPAPVKDNVAL